MDATPTGSNVRSFTSVSEFLRQIGEFTVPIAVLSALGYYCGFQAQSSYLIAFGIPENVGRNDPAYLIGLGWTEIAATIIALALVYVGLLWSPHVLNALGNRRGLLGIVFGFTWILAFVFCPVVGVLLYVRVIRGYPFLITLSIDVTMLLITAVIGRYFQTDQIKSGKLSRWHKLFSVVYPGFAVYALAVGFLWFIWISSESALRGIRIADRDRGSESRLPKIVACSDRRMGLPFETYDPNLGRWCSGEGRLVTMTDKQVFIYYYSLNAGPERTYGLLLDSVSLMDVKTWYSP